MSGVERPVIVVTGRRRPHELLLLVYGGFIGVVSLLRPSEGSVAATLPRGLAVAWSLLFVSAAVAGLLGAFWRGRTETGLQVEMGGMLMAAGATLFYAFAVIDVVSGWTGWISGGLLSAWTTANLWRAAQIAVDLRGIRAAGG